MEILTKEINLHFENKYSYLKLYNVCYDKKEQMCTLSFLYPENAVLEDIDKQKINNFIDNLLKLNYKLTIKYRKSYLDKEIIIGEISKYLNTFHKSMKISIKKDIEIDKSPENIIVNLVLEKRYYNYFTEIKKEELRQYLLNNFCSDFVISTTVKEDELDFENIEQEKQDRFEKILLNMSDSVQRYRVSTVRKLFGSEISPNPEYIKNVKAEKSSVIFAGYISKKTQKTFTQKKGKQKGKEKYYYTFMLNDESGNIPCLYFCPAANLTKMESLCDTTHILAVGDVRPNMNNKLTYYIKSITLCRECEQINESDKTAIFDNNVAMNNDFYRYVKPQACVILEQEKLFDDAVKYEEFIMNNTFVVYDLETTGLDFNTCEIIEIGAVKIKQGKIVEIFETLCKPHNPIPSLITEINGITNEMVENCHYPEEVIHDFYTFCKDTILCGYNILNFDQKFIKMLGDKENIEFYNQVIDAIQIARIKLILGKYNLKAVCKYFNIPLINAHRATDDATATAHVFLKFFEKV